MADGRQGLRRFDITYPSSPIEVGFYDTGDRANDVAYSGRYCYVADGLDGLKVLDLIDPWNPVEVGSFDFSNEIVRVDEEGGYVFAVTITYGVRIVDVSNPEDPVEIADLDIHGPPNDVDVEGDYAYVTYRDEGLGVVDISTITEPVEVGFLSTDGKGEDVTVNGSYAYIAEEGEGLRIINIADPTTPTEVLLFETDASVWDVEVEDGIAYLANSNSGLMMLDISNPQNPTILGSIDTDGDARGVVIDGIHAYVADHTCGFKAINILDPALPEHVGSYDTGDLALQLDQGDVFVAVADFNNGVYILRSDITQPELSILPTVLDFGSTLDTLQFDILNAGDGILTWGIQENPEKEWITSVLPMSGTQNATVTVIVDRQYLQGSGDMGLLSVTSNGGNQDVTVMIAQETPPLPENWQFTPNTGNGAVAFLPTWSNPTVDGTPMAIGDFVGAFTEDGICCGVNRWLGNHLRIVMWGDNVETPEVEGFQPNEPISYRVYRLSEQQEWVYVYVTYSRGNGHYYPGTTSILNSFTASSVFVDDLNHPDELPNTMGIGVFPNPFTRDVVIEYHLPVVSNVSLSVYDFRGMRIRSLIQEDKPAGYYTAAWDGRTDAGTLAASGTYFCRLETESGANDTPVNRVTEEIILIR